MMKGLEQDMNTPPVDNTLATGTQTHGFTVKRVVELPEIRCVAYELRHDRSGARLLHLHSEDTENLFSAAFRTPPPDDTGLPHILEHTVLCGSQRYPVKDPFVELLKTSLATFLNAMTYPDKTVYPCASMNEQDFFNLVGVYCDAVFHPLITAEHFKQEGHHLDFVDRADPDSPLKINGIVYNEMKGAFSDLDGVISRHTHDIFPDTAYGRESGGDPDAIPDLTYEQFRDFHATYYHPSNAYLLVYGNIPTRKHLAFLDREYLGAFERIEIDTAIAEQPRWSESRRTTFPYPAAADDDPQSKSAVVMTFFANAVTDAQTTLAMHVVENYLLGNAASPLRKALIDSELGSELTHAGYGAYQRDSVFGVGLKETSPDRTDAIVQLVFDTCRQVADEGLDPAKVDAAFHRLELSSREITNMYPLNMMGRVYDSWIYDGDPLLLLEIGQHLDELKSRVAADPGVLTDALRTYVIDNPHHFVMTFVPDAECQPRHEAKVARGLAARRARLSGEELDRIRGEATELERLQGTPNSPEALASLPQLKRGDVSPKPSVLPTSESTVGGRPFLGTKLFANGLTYVQLAVDLNRLDGDLIEYLPLYTEALRKMGAGDDDYAAMAEREAAACGGVSASVSIPGHFDDPDHVQTYLLMGTRGVDDKLPRMLDILEDRLLRCDFTDEERLRNIIRQGAVHRHANLVPAGNTFATLYAQRNLSRNAALSERVGGVTQVRFYERLAEHIEDQIPDTVARLKRIHAAVLRRDRLHASVLGDADGLRRVADWYGALLDAMADGGRQSPGEADADVTALSDRVGLALPAEVAFVARAFRAVGAADPLAPALLVLAHALSFDYLWHEVRAKRGAYGCQAHYNQGQGLFSFASYRDPCIRETLDTYAAVPRVVAEEFDLSDDAVEQCIIGAVKVLDRPIRPGSAVAAAMMRHLTGVTWEKRVRFRESLLSVTGDELRRAAETIIAPGLATAPTCVLSSHTRLDKANGELTEKLAVEDV